LRPGAIAPIICIGDRRGRSSSTITSVIADAIGADDHVA
jgi:hypothetical protein